MNRQRHGTTVVNYRLKLNELKSSFNILKKQQARDERKAEALQAELVSSRAMIKKQEAAIKSLKRQNAVLSNTAHASSTKLETATDRLRRLEAKVLCAHDASAANAITDRGQEKQQDLEQKVSQQAATMQDLQQRVTTYEATIEATVEEIDVLSRALSLKVSDLQRADPRETVQSTLLFQFARAQKDLQVMEQNLSTKTAQVEQLLRQLEGHKVRLCQEQDGTASALKISCLQL